MNSDSLKQRLSELKKATFDLKERVNKDDAVEKSAIDALLSFVPKNKSQRNSYILEVDEPPRAHPASASQGSVVLAMFNNNAPSPDKSQWAAATTDRKQTTVRDIHQLEAQKMSKEADELQRELAELSASVKELRRIEREVVEERWKAQIPFMSHRGEAGVFATKMAIEECDFDKVDHEGGRMELECETLYLSVPNRPDRELLLSNLGEVVYIGGAQMRLEFKGEEPVWVYMEFPSEQERKEWDLAFFVNRSILTSPDFDRALFNEEHRPDTPTQKERAVHFNLPDKNASSGSVSKNSSMRSLKVSYAKSQSQDPHALGQSPSGNGLPFKQSAVSVGEVDDKEDLEVFGGGGSSHNDSNTHTSKFNINDTVSEQMDIYQTFMPNPDPPPIQVVPQVIPPLEPQPQSKYEPQPAYAPPQPAFPAVLPLAAEPSLLEKARSELKNGFYFTKFAKNGLNPHDKHVFVNESETSLVSADAKNEKDTKVIPLADITAIQPGEVGEGIAKHLTTPNKDYFCVVEYEVGGESKVLEFGCQKNTTFISNFCLYLREVIRARGLPPPR